jgi:hypothetical protein
VQCWSRPVQVGEVRSGAGMEGSGGRTMSGNNVVRVREGIGARERERAREGSTTSSIELDARVQDAHASCPGAFGSA